MIRRTLLALAAVAWLPLAGASAAQSTDTLPGDMAMGRADAPVTVVEYASVTCGHCANWHASVYPEFKRRFIDTGRVRFVFRELPTSPQPVAMAGFLMARCAGPDRYFDVIDDLMDEQRAILGNPRQQLIAIGARHGLSEAQFNACVTDEAEISALQMRVDAALDRGVNSTPTFYVNGTRVGSGSVSLQTLEAAIVAAER